MPKVIPDGPAPVSGRGRLSSEPHAKFQFRNTNITLGVGPVPLRTRILSAQERDVYVFFICIDGKAHK